MATIRHRAIEPKDLKLKLRAGDLMGVHSYGVTSSEAARLSVANSIESWAVEVDGVLVALWGYGANGLLGHTAFGWLLTTPEIEKSKFAFARSSRRIVNYILTLYPEIETMVHYRHKVSISWLYWLGFRPSNRPSEGKFFFMRKVR